VTFFFYDCVAANRETLNGNRVESRDILEMFL